MFSVSLHETLSTRKDSLSGGQTGRGGGPGADAPCAVCEHRVTKEDLEFEIQFERGNPYGGLDKYHVHVRCFAAWEFERRRPEGTGSDASPLPEIRKN